MSDIADTDFRQPRRYVRLDTILRLRWLAMLGQLVAIFIVSQGLGFDLPILPCLAIVSLSVMLNIALQILFNPVHRLEPPYAALLLAVNIAELAALLFLTGGLQNPFSFLFLAPVLISATALPTRFTIALGILAAACATALAFFHLPLPWDNTEPLVLPLVYMVGVWLSIMLAIGVTSLYAFQVTEEARKLSDALAATELVLTREQHLTQLDGLAAAAAHELGTPLSTIFLISRELEKVAQDNGQLDEQVRGDLKTVREQAQRCRDILAKIAQLSSSGAPFDRMPISSLIEETVAPHRDFGIAIKVRMAHSDTDEPAGMRNPAILYGIGNFMENAVDFARKNVEVNAWWNNERVEIVISDDGPGIAPDILKRIGEPYLSRRRPGEDVGERRGLGLGVFIARTLLERSGARMTFSNRVFPDHGAVVSIAWPRESFETVEILRIRDSSSDYHPSRPSDLSTHFTAPQCHAISRRQTTRASAVTASVQAATPTSAAISAMPDRSLLIVEDDRAFLDRLSRAMESRGFTVTSCDNVADGLAHIASGAPAFAVVDLRLGDGNGLDVVAALKDKRADARAIVLTGYGNIATAVTAVKLGAVDYLSKPADADDVVAALLATGSDKSELPQNPMSADRVRWEHIQRIYEMCNRNVSETARRLNMHRRTLQRILAKRAPR